MEFDITTTKHYDIDCCNDCPFSYCKEDTSCVFDSFDEPNYDWFCNYFVEIHCGEDVSEPKFIGTCFSRNHKRDIPEWCPFKH